MPGAEPLPLHIIGEDLVRIREQRGDRTTVLPAYSPGPCIVCGAPDSTCTGDSHYSRDNDNWLRPNK